jgi:hypothetical protein
MFRNVFLVSLWRSIDDDDDVEDDDEDEDDNNSNNNIPESVGEDAWNKVATAKQPQLPKNVTNFNQATGFQINRRTLRRLVFD